MIVIDGVDHPVLCDKTIVVVPADEHIVDAETVRFVQPGGRRHRVLAVAHRLGRRPAVAVIERDVKIDILGGPKRDDVEVLRDGTQRLSVGAPPRKRHLFTVDMGKICGYVLGVGRFDGAAVRHRDHLDRDIIDHECDIVCARNFVINGTDVRILDDRRQIFVPTFEDVFELLVSRAEGRRDVKRRQVAALLDIRAIEHDPVPVIVECDEREIARRGPLGIDDCPCLGRGKPCRGDRLLPSAVVKKPTAEQIALARRDGLKQRVDVVLRKSVGVALPKRDGVALRLGRLFVDDAAGEHGKHGEHDHDRRDQRHLPFPFHNTFLVRPSRTRADCAQFSYAYIF